MEEDHASAVCSWQYEDPYNIYGWLPWEQMVLLSVEFGDPELRAQQYASVVDQNGDLIGFAQFFPIEGVTRLGVGLRPELCGQGLGQIFMEAIVREALRRAPERIVDLEVLTWNTRAIRAYEKAGFVIADTYEKRTPEGMKQFHCMVYHRK
ncbi:GNAT family N-acetyltransferase [Paenibacillus sediminis]|nr:GNAT family N-acetyltransferase [Paenibacillus sediminis]